MLAQSDQVYHLPGLSLNRFRAMEILSNAMATLAEMMDCQKLTSLSFMRSSGSTVSSWCPRP